MSRGIAYAAPLLLALLLLLLPTAGVAQTVYAVVIGNLKHVVGSSTLRSGLYASSDTGRTWKHLGTENLKAYRMDGVNAERGRVLYIAAGNGVHRSTDGGATWRITTGWEISEVMDVTVDQNDPRWVYAATAFGFWRSGNGGDSWENPTGTLQNHYLYRIQWSPDRSELVACGEHAVYTSRDRGTSWKMTALARAPRELLFTGQERGLIATAEGPTELHLHYEGWGPIPHLPKMNTYALAHDGERTAYAAGDSGVWENSDPYAIPSTWRDITGSIPSRVVHALGHLGGTLVAGTFGQGIYRRETPGAPWVPSGLDDCQVWSITVKPW